MSCSYLDHLNWVFNPFEKTSFWMTQAALSEEGRDVLSRTIAEIKSRLGAESIAAQGKPALIFLWLAFLIWILA